MCVCARIADAIKLFRSPNIRFLAMRMLTRIVDKMRQMDKTRQKDFVNNCHVGYFVSVMPLVAKKTENWIFVNLIRNSELSFLHSKAWVTMEHILKQLQSAPLPYSTMEQDFDQFYKEFAAFCSVYRLTIVRLAPLSLPMCICADICPTGEHRSPVHSQLRGCHLAIQG